MASLYLNPGALAFVQFRIYLKPLTFVDNFPIFSLVILHPLSQYS